MIKPTTVEWESVISELAINIPPPPWISSSSLPDTLTYLSSVSFDADILLQYFDEVIADVLKSTPASSYGEYIKSVYISSTMGPSIPVDINL